MLNRRLFPGIIFFLTLLFFTNVSLSRNLQEIKKSGVIYGAYSSADTENLNIALAKQFANYLGVKLVVVPTDWDAVFTKDGKLPVNFKTDPKLRYTPDALQQADFIFYNITALDWRKKFFDFAKTFYSTELLIIRSDTPQPQEYEELKGKTIAFFQNTSYETNINHINHKIGGGVKFRYITSDAEAEKLLKSGEIYGFITDSNLGLQYAKNNPEFQVAFPVGPIQKFVWGVEHGNQELSNEIERFFEQIINNKTIDRIFETHLGRRYTDFVDFIHSFPDVFSNPEIQRSLDDIINSGELVVALRERDMVYAKEGRKQFNHALAEEFARYLDVNLRIVMTPYFGKYWENKQGEIVKDSMYTPQWFKHFDLACDIITETNWRSNKVEIFGFIPEANTVIGRKSTNITEISDLKKLQGVTIQGAVYLDLLKNEGINNFYYAAKASDLINAVATGKADYTISSNALYVLNQYPDLEIKLILGKPKFMGWACRRNQPKFTAKVREFLHWSRENGIIDSLFKEQTGVELNTTIDYLTVYQETFQTGHLPFVFYGINDGLPQEEVLSIMQDNKGYMWFGTQVGAVRYNGREMHLLQQKNQLSENAVFDIAQDSAGVIFFATSKGISSFDNKRVNSILPDISYKNIFIDAQNNKWFTGDNGIQIVSAKNKQIDLNKRFSQLPKNISAVTQNQHTNNYYIATSGGLFELSPDMQTLEKIISDYCYYVFADRQHKLWISTSKGLFVSNINDIKPDSIGKPMNKKLEIPKVIIRFMEQTHEGDIWLFASKKAFQVLSTDHKAIGYDANKGLKNYKIMSFADDNEGNLWFGFAGGIQKLTNKNLRIFYPNQLDNFIYSIAQDNNGRIWIGADNGIYYFKDELANFSEQANLINKTSVAAILPNQNIVIGNTNGLYEIDRNNLEIVNKTPAEVPIPGIQQIFVSSTGQIFLLTGRSTVYFAPSINDQLQLLANENTVMVNQLIEFDNKIIGGNTNGLIVFENNQFQELLAFDYDVMSLFADNQKVWLGSKHGLWIYENHAFKAVAPQLEDKVITAITPAKNGTHLWLGTNRGVVYFNKNTKETEYVVDSKDGLSGNEVAHGSLFVDDDGLLWIGTYHGINFYEHRKKEGKSYAPVCHLERIIVNGEELTDIKHTFSYDENNFNFVITGISFKDERSIEYEFYMKGLDNDFAAAAGKDYKPYYANLPPGKYEFHYRAKGKDGIWSEYQKFAFEIKPPFWKTVWFYIILFLLIGAAIFGVIKWRLNALERRTKKLEALVEQRTAEIRAQKDQIEEKNSILKQKQEEILAQSENLRKANEEIREKNTDLEQKQEEIMAQAEHLKQANDEITNANQLLQDQKDKLSEALKNLKETQSQLIQSEKMASLGQLIAGIAHEINTPLGAIKSSIGTISDSFNQSLHQLPELLRILEADKQKMFFKLIDKSLEDIKLYTSREERKIKRKLRKQLEEHEVENADDIADTLVDMSIHSGIDEFMPLIIHKNAEEILETAYNLSVQQKNSQNIKTAVERASKVVFALKNYSRQDHTESMVHANIGEGIDTVLTLYHNQLKHGIEVVRNFSPTPDTLCYPDELNQVWTNIIHNAIQAMDNSGTLQIDVEEQDGYVISRFKDSGKGIPDDIKKRIFDPFFTTKPAGEGTGLGLDIVKKIIEKHNGTITVESELGKGATFIISLPVRNE